MSKKTFWDNPLSLLVAIPANLVIIPTVAVGAIGKAAWDGLTKEDEEEAAKEAEKIERVRAHRAELKAASEARNLEDDQLKALCETFKEEHPKGGLIFRIKREYDTYTSVWEYRYKEDGRYIRTRPGDNATVDFGNTLMSVHHLIVDFDRYRHCEFKRF